MLYIRRLVRDRRAFQCLLRDLVVLSHRRYVLPPAGEAYVSDPVEGD